MSHEFVFFTMSLFSIGTIAFALLFAIGVIWRVEMELDISYKFFGFALFFLLISEITRLIPKESGGWFSYVSPVAFLFSSIAFFVAVYLMRDIVRRIDGEKI